MQPDFLIVRQVLLAVLLGLAASCCQAEDKPPRQPEQGVRTAKGKFGQGVNFRATPLRTTSREEYRTFPVTVEFWLKLPDEKKARYNVLLSNAPGSTLGHWELYTTPKNGLLTVRIADEFQGTLRTFFRLTDEKWHYVAMTCDGREVAVSVDGKPQGKTFLQPTEKKPALQPGSELFVGSDLEMTDENDKEGTLDELRISNIIREISEVPSQPFEADEHTMGLWHFDEQVGTRRADTSQLDNSLAYSPGVQSAWTPLSSTRPDAEPWEQETDDDWRDERPNQIERGPAVTLTMNLPATFAENPDVYVPRGLAIRVGDDQSAGVLFDRARLQLCGGWEDGFVSIPPRRFGLIQHPTPAGEMIFSTPNTPAWAPPSLQQGQQLESVYAPIPSAWGRYEGLYRNGNKTVIAYRVGQDSVLEHPWTIKQGDYTILTRTVEVARTRNPTTLTVLEGRGFSARKIGNVTLCTIPIKEGVFAAAVVTGDDSVYSTISEVELKVGLNPSNTVSRFQVLYWRGAAEDLKRFAETVSQVGELPSLEKLAHGGSPQWKETLTTEIQPGKPGPAAPFVVDNLVLPEENPWKTIFFMTGLGFLPNGKLAVSSIYGDVWIVSGYDQPEGKLTWKRFAAGLYQPLGLVVKDGKILVLERGQITALQDLNEDGEADFFENIYSGWDCTGAGHAYDTGLKLAPDGSLFFFKGQVGSEEVCRESGCLLRVLPDHSRHEIYSTGFRHPIGLGMSPEGVVTGADQQGNWMPATRVDQYQKGGFYGDMRTHHREIPPTTYDPPICWLPHHVDNSAGGQVWIPKETWGPLGGGLLHFSWGRCQLYSLMKETVNGQVQGGVVQLPTERLLSGPMTGMFNPHDGHLYLVGLHGWSTAAVKDGCLQRVRYTGEEIPLPVSLHVHPLGIKLEFAQELDEVLATNPESFQVEQWNYRYSGNYGSDHWSVANPEKTGHDPVKVEDAQLLDNGKTVLLLIPGLQPVMQMKIDYRLKSKSGLPLISTVYNTINALPGE